MLAPQKPNSGKNEMNLRNVYQVGKTHLVDSTAALVVTNPIFAVFENVVWGMSDEVSLNASFLLQE